MDISEQGTLNCVYTYLRKAIPTPVGAKLLFMGRFLVIFTLVCLTSIAMSRDEQCRIRYSVRELMMLRNHSHSSEVRLPPDLFVNIELDDTRTRAPESSVNFVSKVRSRARGRRAGSHMRRHIPVRLSNVRKMSISGQTRCDNSNLINTKQSQSRTYLPSVLLTNTRSLNNKFSDLEAVINSQFSNTQLIAISETWFSQNIPASSCLLRQFRQFHRDRNDRLGGGVALYVRDDINSSQCFIDIVPHYLEVLWVKLQSSSTFHLPRVIYVCVLYSPPRSQHRQELSDHIVEMVDLIRARYDNPAFIIMGDFNDLDTDPICQHTLLSQVVTNPTRGSAVLDKILTDLSEHYFEPTISAPVASSDHSLVHFCPRNTVPPIKSSKFSFRPFRDSAVHSFGQWITEMDWSPITNCTDANEMTGQFQHLLVNMFQHHFEMVSINRRPNDKDWMTNRLRRLIAQRDDAFKRKSDAYKPLRNQEQREIKSARNNFYDRKVAQLRTSEPLLEFGAPVWSSSLTISQRDELERVQKRALRMISYPNFDHYCELLKLFKLDTLNDRRISILTRFGKCLLTSARHRHFLPLTRNVMSGRNLRNAQQLHTPRTRTQRYNQSTIPSLVHLLNSLL